MKYEFFADRIDLGIDDAEEVYAVTFTQSAPLPEGGPPLNYLLLQRSVAGLDDVDLREPYIEINDAANGRFAGSVAEGELLPTYFHLQYGANAHVQPHPGAAEEDITDLVVRFNADGPLLRKLKYAMELVISRGFAWRSIA